MLAITVRQGTRIKVLATETTNLGDERCFTTKREHMFFREDIVADPRGNLGTFKPGDHTTAGFLARSGFYGFRLSGGEWGRFEGQILFAKQRDLQFA